MPDFSELNSFIERTQTEFADEFHRYLNDQRKHKNKLDHNWQQEFKEKFKKSQKKYSLSEKGKVTCRKRSRNGAKKRNERFKKACEGLTEEERIKIRWFYRKKPLGYHVDHIIPLYKGGLHRLDNLQYLTPSENAKKGVT